jgi:hypothetical protein
MHPVTGVPLVEIKPVSPKKEREDAVEVEDEPAQIQFNAWGSSLSVPTINNLSGTEKVSKFTFIHLFGQPSL